MTPACYANVLILLACLACSVPASAQAVTRIIDGDTVVVAGIGSVRLIGIDAPEMTDQRPEVLALAKASTAFVQRIAHGQTVRLEYDRDRHDKYGRTLAYLYLSDGLFLNAEIVRQGYGFAYTRYPFRYLEQFRGLEREARTANRGLWNSPSAGTAPRSLVTTASKATTAIRPQLSMSRAPAPSITRLGVGRLLGARSLSH